MSRSLEVVGQHLLAQRWHLAVAESLTGGLLAAALAQGPQASEWFRGGIVAYHSAIKYKLLGVSEGPVVSERCAVEMARGVCTLLDAEMGLALTGVGGPEPVDGIEPGTVWVGVHADGRDFSELIERAGLSPKGVCEVSCAAAVGLISQILEGADPTPLR